MKTDQLRDQVVRGEYNVDATLVADAILRRLSAQRALRRPSPARGTAYLRPSTLTARFRAQRT